jgi:hypothetical protein
MKRVAFFLGAALLAGCASDKNQGGAGTTPLDNTSMERKMEIGPQKTIGPAPEEESPATRGLDRNVPGPNAPDRGDKGHDPAVP